MVQVKFLGHACFQFDDGQYKVLVDPFLMGNPSAAVSADDVEADYIFVTHGHGDHIGDAIAIASLQKTVDEVAKLGGGVVFLRAGRYRFSAPVTVRRGVTVRGDYSAARPSAGTWRTPCAG